MMAACWAQILLCLTLVIFLGFGSCTLPPGYEDELYCPEGHCLSEKDAPPGFTGPRVRMHHCIHMTEKKKDRPRGWGDKLDIKYKEIWMENGYHTKTCKELGFTVNITDYPDDPNGGRPDKRRNAREKDIDDRRRRRPDRRGGDDDDDEDDYPQRDDRRSPRDLDDDDMRGPRREKDADGRRSPHERMKEDRDARRRAREGGRGPRPRDDKGRDHHEERRRMMEERRQNARDRHRKPQKEL